MVHSQRIFSPFIIGLIVLLALGNFQLNPVFSQAQSTFPNIVSYRVNGSANYSSPGSEQFWSSINWTNVPLSASVAPGGGHTPSLHVKSANDGFDVYLLLRWNDTAGPSYLSESEMYRSTNGSLLPLTYAATANVTQLFYNSTYYYPDRAAILWFVANQSARQQSPVMMLGTNGAITGGAAEIWHWQTDPTDNSANDSDFPGGYTDPAGNPVFPSDNLSFAEDDYTNTTGFFVVAGSFGADSPNLDPYASPFLIHVGSLYSYANKTWTVEMVRTLTTQEAAKYRVELASGSSYFVALAVWQGRLGESAEFKSVSQWYNLTISDQAASVHTTTATSIASGVAPTLAVAVTVAALIVGFVIGTVIRASPPREKKK